MYICKLASCVTVFCTLKELELSEAGVIADYLFGHAWYNAKSMLAQTLAPLTSCYAAHLTSFLMSSFSPRELHVSALHSFIIYITADIFVTLFLTQNCKENVSETGVEGRVVSQSFLPTHLSCKFGTK